MTIKPELNTYARYRLNEDEEQLLLKYREQKVLLEQECIASGIDINSVRHYWYKSKLFSIFAKPKDKSILELKKELMKDMDSHSPKYPVIKRKKNKDAHCLVVDPADIHIGKLADKYETGDDYNSNIAIKRVKEGVNGLLDKTSSFPIDQIVLIIGNDILHTDTPKRTTTSGTPQDTDGMWYTNFILAKTLYVDIIEQLLTVANVHVIHNVSNHDYMAGWYLAEAVKSWFRLSKNITFDTNMTHRKAYVYHNNLIGTTHGDGAKSHELPLLLAQEFKQEWANTTHRYIYEHHIHHKRSKDHVGVTIESVRSASGADGWHSRNGFDHAPKAIEAFLHHKTQGQIARFVHIFS